MNSTHAEEKRELSDFSCPACKDVLKVPKDAVQVFCVQCKQ